MKKIFINPNLKIKEAANILSKSGERCLVVINKEKKLLGTLSSGDIRRNIIKGVKISNYIKNIYNKNPLKFLDKNFSRQKAKNIFLKKNCDLIPIVSKDNKVKKIIFFQDFFKKRKTSSVNKINSKIIVMAGGFGTRLEPVTKILPKPLIPIKGKPIIEHIIDSFVKRGGKNFIISIHYKGKLLRAYFDELNPKYSINYIEEKTPLGSAGSLSLLKKKLKSPFFVINCDTIINADFKKILEFHKKNDYDLTIIVVKKKYKVPYGVCEINSTKDFKKLKEKPNFNFLINTGLYVFSPKILNLLPLNKKYNMNELINDAKRTKKKIGVFKINNNSWVDIGQWNDYKAALKKIKNQKEI